MNKFGYGVQDFSTCTVYSYAVAGTFISTFQGTSQKNQANGYAGLSASGTVSTAQIATGTASAGTVPVSDGVGGVAWQAVSGTGASSTTFIFMDSEVEEPFSIPGQTGAAVTTGATGPMGAILYMEPDPEEPMPLPGATGQTGPTAIVQGSYLYASAVPVVNGLGKRFYAERAGTITWCEINVVNGDGISSAQADILKNGSSIFPSSTKPIATAGQYIGSQAIPDVASFSVGDYFQVNILDNGATNGQIRVYIHFNY